jgi:ferredoxin-NADP reductase
MLSMLRILQTDDPDRPVLLLWGNRTPEDVFLKEELDDIQKAMKHLRLIHVFSESRGEVSGYGEHAFGFIDAGVINEYIEKAEDWETFVCGPPVMMKKLIPELRRMGFPGRRIHQERFGL